ncbi:hypothetical protein ACSHXN_41810 [Streptomyces sp. HUAS TT11]|uniref:hypothetical protein n=1 Tax=Streptomyces sp. HUAS TT11 TaxID=3447508 RepID=UPI003F65DDB3
MIEMLSGLVHACAGLRCEDTGVGRRRESLHVVDGRLQRILQRGDVPCDLGEEGAALEGGKEQRGRPCGIRLGADAADGDATHLPGVQQGP